MISKDLKYKVGEKVWIKKFQRKPSHWNIHMFNDWMDRIVTIKEARNNSYPYRIEENQWGYYEHDFSPIVDLLEDSLFEI